MSFSEEIKQELCRVEGDHFKELLGLTLGAGSLIIRKNEKLLHYKSTYPCIIRKVIKLFKVISIRSKSVFKEKSNADFFVVNFKIDSIFEENFLTEEALFDYKSLFPYVADKNGSSDFLRGVFLTKGSVILSPPHLEMEFQDNLLNILVHKVLRTLKLPFKTALRRKKYLIYMKKREHIKDFLYLTEAKEAYLRLEEDEILKNTNVDVSRRLNFELSNLKKTTQASKVYTDAIRKLIKEERFRYLDNKTIDIAMMRLKHPDYSFETIAKNMTPPVSKSTVEYHLRKLLLFSLKSEAKRKRYEAETKAKN